MGILSEITTTWTRNPPEEGDSAGNYQLIDEESTQGRGFHREFLAYSRGFRPVRSKCEENPSHGNNSRISSFKSYILTMLTFKKKINFEDLFKINNKPNPAQLGTSYLSN
jgi:hypothetical protein